MKQPTPELVRRISRYAAENKGKIYAPIDHPAFASIPFHHGPERFELIRPHLPAGKGTALDIGSHWGYMAHRLEDLGFRVTALESSAENAANLRDIRDVCGKSFEVIEGSVFDLGPSDYDLVLALNIFHHFMKNDKRFAGFNKFLQNLKCRTMIYQAHAKNAKAFVNTPHYMHPADMAEYIAQRLQLPNISEIGVYNGRPIYKLAAS